jgi:hypothetical protein
MSQIAEQNTNVFDSPTAVACPPDHIVFISFFGVGLRSTHASKKWYQNVDMLAETALQK